MDPTNIFLTRSTAAHVVFNEKTSIQREGRKGGTATTCAVYLSDLDTLVIEHTATGNVPSELALQLRYETVHALPAATRLAVTMADQWIGTVTTAIDGRIAEAHKAAVAIDARLAEAHKAP